MNPTVPTKPDSDKETPDMKFRQLTQRVSRPSLLKSVIPNTAGGRRTMNVFLLSVALPGLLLGLALVYVLTASPPSSVTESGPGDVTIRYASEERFQSVNDLAVSSILPAASLPSRDLVEPGTSNPTTGIVAPALAVVAVLLAALAGVAILRSCRQTRPQPVNEQPQAVQDPTVESPDSPAVTAHEVSQRLVAIQESVRRDMADYLHGHVQSKLLALSMALSNYQKLLAQDPADAYRLLERIQTELQRVQDEDLRQVSRELYPAIIKMGLVPAMRSLISRFSDSIEIDLLIDADVFALDAAGEARLPEKQRLGIYRIAEEALNNVLKHANADHIEVSLIHDSSDRLVLSVSDDGLGFDPVSVTNCHGLAMMSDYAEAIGGKADMNSSIGQGTTISLVMPLKSPVPGPLVIAGNAPAQVSKGF
jgi:signal transduction histidine kinase